MGCWSKGCRNRERWARPQGAGGCGGAARGAPGRLAACSTWHPYTPPVGAETELPTRVRFDLESGESIELKRPRLEGDSVYVGEVSPRRITRVPVSSVVSLERAQVAIGRTVFAVVGGVALAMGFLFLGVMTNYGR